MAPFLESKERVQHLRDQALLVRLLQLAVVNLVDSEVVKLAGKDRVGRRDVLGTTDAGDLEDRLFLVGLDAGPGLEDQVAVGQYLDDLRRDPGREVVAALILALPIELLLESGVERGQVFGPARPDEQIDEILEPDVRPGVDLARDLRLLLGFQLLGALGERRLADNDLDQIVLLVVAGLRRGQRKEAVGAQT